MKQYVTVVPSPIPPLGRAHALFRDAHLLAGVPATVLAELAARGTVRELGSGEPVWREGDRAQAFHVIGRGLIRCRRHLRSGSEVTLGIFGPRESIGDTAALEDAPYPADAVVVSEDAVLLAIPSHLVRDRSMREPALAHALQRALLRHTEALRTKVAIMAAGSVRARLANLFVHLAARFGERCADGTVRVPLSLSRGALASLVSARTETVIRALRPWEKTGVVVTTADGFVLAQLDALRACADEG